MAKLSRLEWYRAIPAFFVGVAELADVSAAAVPELPEV
jgi:hypothetical protein